MDGTSPAQARPVRGHGGPGLPGGPGAELVAGAGDPQPVSDLGDHDARRQHPVGLRRPVQLRRHGLRRPRRAGRRAGGDAAGDRRVARRRRRRAGGNGAGGRHRRRRVLRPPPSRHAAVPPAGGGVPADRRRLGGPRRVRAGGERHRSGGTHRHRLPRRARPADRAVLAGRRRVRRRGGLGLQDQPQPPFRLPGDRHPGHLRDHRRFPQVRGVADERCEERQRPAAPGPVRDRSAERGVVPGVGRDARRVARGPVLDRRQALLRRHLPARAGDSDLAVRDRPAVALGPDDARHQGQRDGLPARWARTSPPATCRCSCWAPP